MSINRTVPARLMVVGAVISTRALRTVNEKPDKPKGTIYGYESLIENDGARVGVKFLGDSEADAGAPSPGEYVALWVSINDGREFTRPDGSTGRSGSEALYQGVVTPGDLDMIHSSTQTPVKV